jgi:hypothetical protein
MDYSNPQPTGNSLSDNEDVIMSNPSPKPTTQPETTSPLSSSSPSKPKLTAEELQKLEEKLEEEKINRVCFFHRNYTLII